MMIVQPRKECAAPRIDFVLIDLGSDAIGNLGDHATFTTKVDAAITDFGVVDQQGAVQ